MCSSFLSDGDEECGGGVTATAGATYMYLHSIQCLNSLLCMYNAAYPLSGTDHLTSLDTPSEATRAEATMYLGRYLCSSREMNTDSRYRRSGYQSCYY